jgi:periplasmic protein CpxP/Spy
MNRTTLLTVVAALLLVANLAMVTMMFMDKRHAPGHGRPPHHAGPRDIIIERLGFDDAQVKQYDRLIEGHRTRIHDLDRQMMDARSALYSGLTEESTMTSDSLLGVIAQIQLQVEQTHVLHFADIRDLCRDDQLQRFEEMTSDLARYFGHPRPPKR